MEFAHISFTYPFVLKSIASLGLRCLGFSDKLAMDIGTMDGYWWW
ncbi:pentatricopeptide repeat-containing protein [Corchorus olitorius]|uniref:Pentatricopeptide repeat-containing protein n=1 Tax=Corchorus olitorius TaxID=93759 RepID=A0A1R3KFF3_9ROSI|nr:pentatricopeptide repeat-containing protein [Corchorus olitorius]